MRIVIDLQGAQTKARFRGIGRYSVELAKSLIRNKRNHEIFLALSDFSPETAIELRKTFNGLLPQDHIRVWEAPSPTFWADSSNTHNRKIAEIIYTNFIASLQPDLLIVTSVIEGFYDSAVFSNKIPMKNLPIAIVEYDLIPYAKPREFLTDVRMQEWYYGRLKFIEEAQLVLSISNYSRLEFIQKLNSDPQKIIAIGTDTSTDFYREDITVADKKWLNEHRLNRPFILYVGGGDERKNTNALLHAYTKLSDEIRLKHQLVFVCGMDETGRINILRDIANKNGLPDDSIIFLDYLTSKELRLLYNACKLFVFPSLYEGFGLTPLEAMRCGAAVIGSNTTSIPEVIGNDEALFDPTSVDSIAQKMAQVLSDDKMLQRLKRHSLVQQGKFSWDITANRCLDAFEKLIPPREPHESLGLQQRIERTIDDLKPILTHNVNLAQIAYELTQTFDPPQERREKTLFVDISELVQRDVRSGIQRVVRSILLQLLKNPPEGYKITPVYATSDSLGYLEARRFMHKFFNSQPDYTIQDIPIDYHPNDFFLGLDFQSIIVPKQKQFLDMMSAHGVTIWYIIYDMLPILLPEDYFGSGMRNAHFNWLHIISRYDGVVCISKAVANDYTEWFNKNKLCTFMPEVTWFHIGSDIGSSVPTKGLPKDAPQVLKSIKARPTFLMVSTIEPRKGYAQAFAAFELLWQEGIDVNLVIVGKKGWNVDDLAAKMKSHQELGKRFFWLQGISDEYLEKVYDASTCVIMASEGEGFGLAVVEGARHGKPLILRNLPVFREIAGNHAYYFEGLKPEDLARSVTSWLDLYKQGQAPSSKGVEVLTWEDSAKMLISKLPLD